MICPNGEPLRLDFDRAVTEPDPAELERAQASLPPGKGLAFNEYTGELQAVDQATIDVGHGDATVAIREPLLYRCDENNEPTLVPLSAVDPDAAEQLRSDYKRQLQDSEDLTGLGEDPAHGAPMP